jgi:hypothetical protein
MSACYSCVGSGRRTPRQIPDRPCPRCKGSGREPGTFQPARPGEITEATP